MFSLTRSALNMLGEQHQAVSSGHVTHPLLTYLCLFLRALQCPCLPSQQQFTLACVSVRLLCAPAHHVKLSSRLTAELVFSFLLTKGSLSVLARAELTCHSLAESGFELSGRGESTPQQRKGALWISSKTKQEHHCETEFSTIIVLAGLSCFHNRCQNCI